MWSENIISFSELAEKTSEIQSIFFYRICGTGMGAAACLLKEKGLKIEGGDSNYYPPMSDYLRATNIPLWDLTHLNLERLKAFDLIVVGNVVPGQSDEARELEKLGVPLCSFPAALGAFVLKDIRNVVGIAGTHGKTTTTYFCAQLFEKLGMEPGYFIGGVLEGKPPAQLGRGEYFFIESDEYDSAYFEKFSKFHSYFIDHLVLTSLEYDHADIFEDMQAIELQFQRLVPEVSSSYLFNLDYPIAKKLYESTSGTCGDRVWMHYGLNDINGPHHIRSGEKGSSFELNWKNEKYAFETNIVGEHNILNLSVAIFEALRAGAAPAAIKSVLHDIKLVKRRQEVRGHYHQAIIIDDFAHHPTAVRLTLEAIHAAYPKRHLYVVLEPNSATARSSLFQKEFGDSLPAFVEHFIIAKPQKKTTVENLSDLDCRLLADFVQKNHGISSEVAEDLSFLRARLEDLSQQESVIAILSNGTCLGLWSSNFQDELV